MKKRNVILSMVLFLSILAWQCSKQSTTSSVGAPRSLKASLTINSEKLSKAVNIIAQSNGSKLLNLNSSLKSASIMADPIFKDSITLATIRGIYEYKPVTYHNWCYNCLSKLFTKTGNSDSLIVKLPSEKIFYPYRFETVVPADSTLKNNFVIAASAYHYYFNKGFLHDYNLTAGVSVSDSAVGNLHIQSTATSLLNYAYASAFTFPSGYTLQSNITSGDTVSYSFSLSSITETLLKESINLIQTTGSRFREREYILDIGNVEFKKAAGADTLIVYVSGVLQTKAKIIVIDQPSNTGDVSIFRNRDIQVTFDDGTTATISSLIGPSLTVLGTLSGSLQDVYFASNLVNYIAWNIYKNRIN